MNRTTDIHLVNASRIYHGNPDLRVLARLIIEEERASRRVIDEPNEAPLGERVSELHSYLRPSDEITEFTQISQALGIAPRTILLCDDLGGNLAQCFGEEAGLSSGSRVQPFIAFNVPAIASQDTLTPLDLILHELAHEYFTEHDAQFATLVNWQRLRCGLPVLSDTYDVCQAQIERQRSASGAITGLAIAHRLATELSRVDLSRDAVAQVVEQTFWQADEDTEPDEVVQIALGMVPAGE